MIPFQAFKSLLGLIDGTRQRITNEHLAFLDFYQALVKEVSPETAKGFGRISTPVTVKGKVMKGYQMELTPEDYLWWRSAIVDDGGRFISTVGQVQRDIWDQLGKLVLRDQLTPEDRNELMTISTLLNHDDQRPLDGEKVGRISC